MKRMPPPANLQVNLKARRVDPTVNLAANLDDGLSSGFGIAHNASRVRGPIESDMVMATQTCLP